VLYKKAEHYKAIEYFLDHRFDLLGSGWVQVFLGMKCRGFEGHLYTSTPSQVVINKANQKASQMISALIDKTYVPLDWQIDFKSGKRWRENTYYKEITYGVEPGVDIKVPWELARMQDLPQLALAYAHYKKDPQHAKLADRCLFEFRNQILDFIAMNPPKYGVNWRCTMDVGIRIANWLIAYDLFRSQGVSFDRPFEEVFARSVYEHGKHCVTNLEYSPDLRSNHYLSDIAGLLFCSVYLADSPEISSWLVFSLQEFVSEMKSQFHADGSNFEASTSYHRLSTEIILWPSLLVCGLDQNRRDSLKTYNAKSLKVRPPLKPIEQQEFDIDSTHIFPDWYWHRLEKALEFTADIIKPTGKIHQVGDNDSGRFLKLEPSYHRSHSAEKQLNEDFLDHRHLLSAGSALFQREEWEPYAKEFPTEASLVSFFCKSLPIKTSSSFEKNASKTYVLAMNATLTPSNFTLLEATNLRDNLETFAYPDFGIFGWKSPKLYLAVRCGSIGQNGNGGHAHNDQLSVELTWNGEDLYQDPGTYVYTPDPKMRTLFRSTRSHCVPTALRDEEQNDISGLFTMKKLSEVHVLGFDKHGGAFRFKRRSGSFDLNLKITETKIISNQDIYKTTIFSEGYGKK
nr:alginate lyase family protein [Oligoflexales bacterium]